MKKGLILGRFQPLHMGHLSLFETVIDNGEELLICIGSSNEERTENNPYNSSERIKMIKAVLSNYDCKYAIFEIPDTPFIQESQASDNVLPIGDNIPKPVTTTLLCSCFMQKNFSCLSLCNLQLLEQLKSFLPLRQQFQVQTLPQEP